ncbi:hypothetical protein PVAP13_4KG274705 [Panicum virgatum]|uniref:Uncharacterized protein n=1 Tax=Panicum virgatum TaxID=38727 RepID=A0A8T0TU39_PANVG|nr:hypothetical protein PVAP13_4KG274705 [Panicum virgatum]
MLVATEVEQHTQGEPGKADVGEALLDAVTAPSQYGHSNGRKIYSVDVFV